MTWNLENRTADDSENTLLFALVNNTGGAAYAVRIHTNDVAAIEVFRTQPATPLHGPLDIVYHGDDIGIQIDLGTGRPENGQITVHWSNLPGGQGAQYDRLFELNDYM